VASQTLTIRKPDDWHVHLRDGEMLQKVAPYTARQFARAIVMPNLVPPVTSVEAARDYRKRILEATAPGFTPLMTCYLTDNSSPDEIARGHQEGVWVAAKLYPAGATTNSASGVTDIRNIYPALARMEEIGMVLCVHGEVTDADVDVFDREAVFIDRVLTRNAVWVGRTQGVGVLTAAEAINYSLSGPMLRASGVAYDVRKDKPYLDYETYDFDVVVGEHGDVYDRYLVRLEECSQANRILQQALDRLPGDLRYEFKVVVRGQDCAAPISRWRPRRVGQGSMVHDAGRDRSTVAAPRLRGLRLPGSGI